MPYIAYEEWNPTQPTLNMINHARTIITEYQAQGYDLTLRQLYYQFVARDLLPNNIRSYKRLGDVVAKARMAGYIDWEAIVDRTRNLTAWRTYTGPEEAMARLRRSYTLEKWSRQPWYVEVWVEKEALAGVFERICGQLEVPFFACRGYVSLSEMWSASQRLRNRAVDGQEVIILHFGDHDPSGIDMSRDIEDRSTLFAGWGSDIEVKRVALNMDQVDQYRPPPNPAKLTDSRAEDYVARFGRQSWELDALEPTVLSALVRDEVEQLRDQDLWDEAEDEEVEHVKVMQAIEQNWDRVRSYLNGDAE